MCTGDITGNLQRLHSQLRRVAYRGEFNVPGLSEGDASDILPILHFVLLDFSPHVASRLSSKGYELLGKTDQRFVQCAFRAFREVLGIKPVLTPSQFLDQGFAERKILLMHEVVSACKTLHESLVRKQPLHTKQRKKVTSSIGPRQGIPSSSKPSQVPGSPMQNGNSSACSSQHSQESKSEDGQEQTSSNDTSPDCDLPEKQDHAAPEDDFEHGFIPLVASAHEQQPRIPTYSGILNHAPQSKIPKAEMQQATSGCKIPIFDEEQEAISQAFLEGCSIKNNTLFEPGELQDSQENPVPRDWSHVQHLYQSKWGLFPAAQQNHPPVRAPSTTIDSEKQCSSTHENLLNSSFQRETEADQKTMSQLCQIVRQMGAALEGVTLELSQLKSESLHEINTLKATVILLDSRVKLLEAAAKPSQAKQETSKALGDSTQAQIHPNAAKKGQDALRTPKTRSVINEESASCSNIVTQPEKCKETNIYGQGSRPMRGTTQEYQQAQFSLFEEPSDLHGALDHGLSQKCKSHASPEDGKIEDKFEAEYQYLSSLNTADFISEMTSRNQQLEENLHRACKQFEGIDPGFSYQQFLQRRNKKNCPRSTSIEDNDNECMLLAQQP